MRLLFFGTPEFAVPALEAVAREHEIALVVAQPDKPAGRGMKMQQPAVIVRALELGLEIAQPAKIRDEGFLTRLKSIAPDAAVVVAYGRILPRRLLDIPQQGFFNVHGSILPRYRGAAPIQRAIEAGETSTGVTIMRVEEQLDHGPILAAESIDIAPDERASSVSRRLARAGADLLVRVLRDPPAGSPQDDTQATHAPKIEKREGLVTFAEPAAEIYNRFRAFDPWPGVFFVSGGETIKIIEMHVIGREAPLPPGSIVALGMTSVDVAVADGAVRLLTLQRAGKPKAPAGDIARGLGWRAGASIP